MTAAESAERESAPDQATAFRTPWAAIALLIAIGISAAAQLGKIPPLAETLGVELGLSLVTIGWAMSVITLVSVVFGLSAGSLLGRIAMKKGLLVALALGTAASFAGAFVSSGSGLLAVRAVEGIGYLVITIACPALIAFNAAGRDRALALALWGCFVATGLALMNQLAPLILALDSWRSVFLAGAAMQAAGFAGLLAVSLEEPVRSEPPRLSRLPTRLLAEHRLAFANPAAVGVAAAFFCFAFLHVGFLSFLPLFLRESTGMSAGNAGTAAAAVALIYIPGALVAARAMRRPETGIRVAIGGFVVIGASAAVIYGGATPAAGIVGASLLLGFAGGICGSVCFGLIPLSTPVPDQLRLANGLLAQFGSLAVLVAAPVLAFLVDRGPAANDWAASIPVFAGGSLVAALLLWRLRQKILSAANP